VFTAKDVVLTNDVFGKLFVSLDLSRDNQSVIQSLRQSFSLN